MSYIGFLTVNLKYAYFKQVVKFIDALKNVFCAFKVNNAQNQAKVLKL